MKAMVLAAGRGTRMQPLTNHLPKPLIAVSGKPLIDHALDWLAQAGVTDAVVNSFYLPELLEAHLAKRQMPRIHISRETELLETGGGITKALPMLGDKLFISVNSDTICIDGANSAIAKLQQYWNDTGMDALLLVHPVEKAVGYEGVGDFFIESDGRLRRRLQEPAAPYVFTGVQLLHPRLFKDAPGGAFSMNVLYNRGITQDGKLNGRIGALVHDGDWLHVGDPKGLAQAEAWFSAR